MGYIIFFSEEVEMNGFVSVWVGNIVLSRTKSQRRNTAIVDNGMAHSYSSFRRVAAPPILRLSANARKSESAREREFARTVL